MKKIVTLPQTRGKKIMTLPPKIVALPPLNNDTSLAIMWKYHGQLFGKSLSQLEALDVLEQLIKKAKN